MKITRRQLRKIIKEESSQPIEENDELSGDKASSNPITQEIQEVFKQVDSIFDKYFDFDGMPNEDSMLDDKSKKMLEKFKKRPGPHYSTPGGKALMLYFLMQRVDQQQRNR